MTVRLHKLIREQWSQIIYVKQSFCSLTYIDDSSFWSVWLFRHFKDTSIWKQVVEHFINKNWTNLLNESMFWTQRISKGAFTPDANEALRANDLHVKSMQRQSCGAIRANEAARMAQITRRELSVWRAIRANSVSWKIWTLADIRVALIRIWCEST